MSTTTAAASATDVKRLLHNWNSMNDGSKYRNDLRRMANRAGLSLEDFIESVFSPSSSKKRSARLYIPRADENECEQLAEMMDDHFYSGQNMRDPEKAADYIKNMAEGYITWDDLPFQGRDFWKAARTNFIKWLREEGKI